MKRFASVALSIALLLTSLCFLPNNIPVVYAADSDVQTINIYHHHVYSGSSSSGNNAKSNSGSYSDSYISGSCSGCFQTLDHTSSYDYYTTNCGKSTSTIESYSLNCGKDSGVRYSSEGVDYYTANCGYYSGEVTGYYINCGKTAGTRYSSEGVDHYDLSCGLSDGASVSTLKCTKTEHTHVGSTALAKGGPGTCYTTPSYHTHTGTPTKKEGCYQGAKTTTSVYTKHKHDSSCACHYTCGGTIQPWKRESNYSSIKLGEEPETKTAYSKCSKCGKVYSSSNTGYGPADPSYPSGTCGKVYDCNNLPLNNTPKSTATYALSCGYTEGQQTGWKRSCGFSSTHTHSSSCYTTTTHSHSGSSSSGGGCYGTAVYKVHSHSGSSYSGGGCYGGKYTHSHSGNSSTYGGCYKSTVYKAHYHSGNSSSGGGCYGTKNYHKHTGNSSSGGGCYGSHQYGTNYYYKKSCPHREGELLATVKFDANGGRVSSGNLITDKSSYAQIKDPVKPGCTFEGWVATGSTSPVKNLTVSYSSTGDCEYKAKWSANSYNINLNLNGGKFKTGGGIKMGEEVMNPAKPGYRMSKYTIPYTVESEDIDVADPVKPGYAFVGWDETVASPNDGVGSAKPKARRNPSGRKRF